MAIPFGDDSLSLKARIGSGATGEVFRAQLQRSGDAVAVKLLHKSLCADREVVSRYRREVTALMNLKHDAFVKFRGEGILDDGRVFLVMELVDGDTLANRLKKRGRFDVRTTVQMFIDACDAFDEAHQMGIVHRDVKPENLMVEEPPGQPPRIRIMDFGFVRFVNEELASEHTALTKAGMTLGTPGFMAMEQLRGEPADQRSDLFAIAVSLYEALTGQLPFAGNTPRALFQAQLKGHVVPLADRLPEEPLAPKLWAVIAAALTTEREKRTASVSLFADGLREALGLRPAPATTLSPGPLRHSARNEPAPAGRSSSSILLGAIGVVVILGAAAAAFFAMRGH